MSFNFFDPSADFRITTGKLPHWYQPGVTYFITFRTDDSFPIAVARQWYHARDEWLLQHGIDPKATDWSAKLLRLPPPQQNDFHNTFSCEFMNHLDKGLGECVLARPELAEFVDGTLRHFDGGRYHLGDFVVMPNHVHVLVSLIGDMDLGRLCFSWKKYSAGQINRALGRKGRFWHEESFDHLIRSPEQFDHFRQYIADNPRKAGLRPGTYLYWRRPDQDSAAPM